MSSDYSWRLLLFIAEHAREGFVLIRGGPATSKQFAFHRGQIGWLVKPEFQKKFMEAIENTVKEDTTKNRAQICYIETIVDDFYETVHPSDQFKITERLSTILEQGLKRCHRWRNEDGSNFSESKAVSP